MATGAIIVAAGRSQRMGGVDKLLIEINGQPLISYSIEVFAMHSAIDQLVVVASESNKQRIEAIAAQRTPDARVVLGGERRRDSVRAGLDALDGCDYVVIHDGARPLVTPALIDAALAGAHETGAALCAVPVSDTLKRVEDSGLIRSTVSREGLWLAQTPQAFRFYLLLDAHASSDFDATDDAALVELAEEPVRIVMGSQTNIKVTTPQDLTLVEALLRANPT